MTRISLLLTVLLLGTTVPAPLPEPVREALALSATTDDGSKPAERPRAMVDVRAVATTGRTVHVAADPGCSSDLNLALVLNTQAGPVYFTPTFPIRPLTTAWKTGMVTLSADAGAMTALTLSLQAFSTSGYQGTIYIDEIDIR